MAKIVEFYGSPGVGKSTIYKQLEGKWKKDFNWIPSHHLYTKNKIKFESSRKFLLTIARSIKNGNVDEVAMQKAGDRFVAQYPEFIDSFWNNILINQRKGYNGLDLRFERAKYFYATIQKIQFLMESNSKKIALIDEGLIQRISHGLFKNENLIEETDKIDETNKINHVLQMMPLPDALVYIETDVMENAKRLVHRKKIISMHKLLSNSEIVNIISETKERMGNITKILEDKGIPLLRVDARLHILENVAKIISFVKSLNGI